MVDKCYIWEKNWTASMPNSVVLKVIKKGIISPDCLPEGRKVELGLVKEEVKPEKEKVV